MHQHASVLWGSNAGIVAHHCGEKVAEPESKVFFIIHSIYHIYVSTLTYDHELSVMTKRMNLRIQMSEIRFLSRVAELSFRDRMRSSYIWRELRLEPLLLRV